MKCELTRASGYVFEFTPFGYFRRTFAVLMNAELYLYESRDVQKSQQLLMLTPGVTVRVLPPISANLKNDKAVSSGEECGVGKVWPIELHVGGVAGNHGILSAVDLKVGHIPTIFTLFFDSE